MNPFRSRKKSHDAGEPPRPSKEPEVPPMPSFASKTFKRNKKALQDSKPQVDIATALPSSDDFRTSLLMPNLSARFSMLREQDDPTSKIGKANDDSVLFPKRASRLNLFNRNELMDIAEVGSVSSSRRPNLKPWGTDSYGSSDSADDDGSHGGIMSRARPGEGNTMFGGRQKIYKIPVGGSGTSKGPSGNEEGEKGSSKGMGGKFLYGDDVSLSAFQKLRERAKVEQEKATAQSSARSSIERDGSNSPSLVSYNHYRETAYSTTSGPSEPRTSTAATSVASQRSTHGGHGIPNGNAPGMPVSSQSSTNGPNMDRQTLKSRRLYGQGLDQHIHEQQSSAMNRLESLHRQRGVGGLTSTNSLAQSRSATNLNERYQRSGPLYAPNEFRAASPSPSGTPPRLAELDMGLHKERSPTTRNRADSAFRRSPPLSPPISPAQDPTLTAALEPNDFGKATASGAFNKPSRQYDEQEFLQRQLRLHQGRETPPLNRPLSPSPVSPDEPSAGRTRGNSVGSTNPSTPASIKYHHDRHSNEHPLAIVPEIPGLGIEDRHSEPRRPDRGEIGPRPDDLDHPIYRSYKPASLSTPPPEILQKNESKVPFNPNVENSTADSANPKCFDGDSPTLGPASGLNDLNGLIKTHVRNESESSIYPDDPPGPPSKFLLQSYHEGNPLGIEPANRRSEAFFHKETWDPYNRDEMHNGMAQPSFAERTEAMPLPLSVKARQIRAQADALRNLEASRIKQTTADDKAQGILGGEPIRASQESSNRSSWRDQLKVHGHARGGSTETAKEQENFANELAERRRMVRDNLKSFVENESRSASPMPASRTHENSPSRQGAAPFGILKPKSSKSSLGGRHDQPSKAMKMMGISASLNNSSASLRAAHDSAPGNESDQAILHHDIKGQPNAKQTQTVQAQNYRPQEQLPRRTSPPSSKPSTGDRSNMGPPNRRSDSPNNQGNGRGIYLADRVNAYSSGGSNYRKYSNAPRPSPELLESLPGHQIPPDPSRPSASGRLRSNSRTTRYYDHGSNLAVQTTPSPNLSMPPPSTPSSARSASSPYENSTSFPSSTTPVMMNSSSSVNLGRVPPHRKKSIQKQDISDPMFISSTSSVGTVALPAGASLSNGMDLSGNAPPVPPFNPRRKRNLILRQALGRGDKPESSPSSTIRENSFQERTNFSADENEQKPKPRQRLRKISSEGGNMNARARQQVLGAPSPAVPHFPQNMATAPSPTMATPPYPGIQRCPTEQTMSASPAMF